ncbi:MAG: hypothetical protein CMH63_03105 [Nanoarchaeota archaeon]|nr:hypothetical protein [Nanoarchaeota archaeon]|tara:strand:+ start:1909 stop:2589 length:681 start_codon:yes stop_codon:yes gene_type:complete
MPKAYSNKNLVFDTSSIISISMNSLLNILGLLKKKFRGEFLISKKVKEELVNRPMKGKKFKLEALQILKEINSDVLKIYGGNLRNKSLEVLKVANRVFRADDYIKILDLAEVESLVIANELNGTYVVDERTMRMLVEDVRGLKRLLEKKLKRRVLVNENNLKLFREKIKDIKIIRSVELGYVAYSLGLLKELDGRYKKELLDGLLWGLKLRGCAISSEEIRKIEAL